MTNRDCRVSVCWGGVLLVHNYWCFSWHTAELYLQATICSSEGTVVTFNQAFFPKAATRLVLRTRAYNVKGIILQAQDLHFSSQKTLPTETVISKI